jgi:AAA domain
MSDQPDYFKDQSYLDVLAADMDQWSSGEHASAQDAPSNVVSFADHKPALATLPRPFTRFSDFIADFEPIAYALDGVMRSGSLYTLTARTGTGKTAFNVILALAVVTGEGKRLLGRDVEQGRVLYVALENPDDVRTADLRFCPSAARRKTFARTWRARRNSIASSSSTRSPLISTGRTSTITRKQSPSSAAIDR